jgi:hypothetical protein
MTRAEYEQRKRRLEEQLQEGIELLKAGSRQQLRALELIWMTTGDEDGSLPQTPAEGRSPEKPAIPIKTAAAPQPAKPSRRPRLRPGQLWDDIDSALDQVPRIFDRHDLLKALGYEPDRASLHRVTTALLGQGVITLKAHGSGRIPAKYEKVEATGEIAEATT